MYGRGRPQLHDQLRRRRDNHRPCSADGDRFLGGDDVRERRADHHPHVLGLRERRQQRAPSTTAPTCSTTATSSSPVGSYPSSCYGRGRPQLRDHVLRWHGRRQRGESHNHRIIAVGDIRQRRSGRHRELLGLRERRRRKLPRHGADLLDDGHVGKPRRQLPDVVLGRGRPQLLHQLPGRDRDGRSGDAGHHGLVRLNHLRRRGAHHHGLVLGVRER